MAQVDHSSAVPAVNPAKRVKLTGRAFYQSIGSPKRIVAPMVDRSEFAWRLLTRSYLDDKAKKELLAYSPMFHARLFQEQPKFRDAHFQPTRESLISKEKSAALLYLDGHPEIDRPLFVQFCANKPEEFLEAAKYVAPYCDAVDLNLGCPQGIAKSGNYGAFLQEDWDTIHNLIRKLRDELEVPVTAKFRIQESREKTLEYAKMILNAGASIITVHGRQRHQKGHNTGIADWSVIRYLRENLPPDTVLFANGNILNSNDIQPCLDATGADGVMSAEGNLSDPTIFAKPPDDPNSREYWRDPWNPAVAGYRIDGVFRRYLDIIHRYVLEQEPPQRAPLYLPGESREAKATATVRAEDAVMAVTETSATTGTKRANEEIENNSHDQSPEEQKQSKKHKKKHARKTKDLAAVHNPNLKPMQGHLFQLLRPMISGHTNIRDALARSRAGDIAAFEHALLLVEDAVKAGLDEEHARLQANPPGPGGEKDAAEFRENEPGKVALPSDQSSEAVRDRCKRPFWVCQPHIRPLPQEALKLGAMQLSKKEKEALAQKEQKIVEARARKEENQSENLDKAGNNRLDNITGKHGSATAQATVAEDVLQANSASTDKEAIENIRRELPQKEALACG